MKTKFKNMLVAMLMTLFTTAINATTTPVYLEMQGNVKQAKEWERGALKNLDSAKFTVYNLQNEAIGEYFSNHSGICAFKVDLNKFYYIKVTKAGWVSKLIVVDTRIPEERLKHFRLPFEIAMYEDIPEIDVSVLLDPIAHVIYNEDLNDFDYNYKYTDRVNAQLKELYQAYYKLKKEYRPLNRLAPELSDKNMDNGQVTASDNSSMQMNNKNDNCSVNNQCAMSTQNVQQNLQEGVQQKAQRPAQLIYKIQILALHRQLDGRTFAGLNLLNEYYHDGQYKYTFGEYTNFTEAYASLEYLRKFGFSDAFIVSFNNGERLVKNNNGTLCIQ